MTGVQTCALPICFPVTIVRVDADGYAVNVVLWDGETPFDADGELVLESECKAKYRDCSCDPEPVEQ